MPDILYDEIPSLNLADFRSNDESLRQQFVKELGDAYNNIGFVAIRNHYLNNELASQLYDVVKKFFALDDTIKQNYELPHLAGQRG